MQASLITRILLTGQLLSRHRSFSLDRPLLSGIARKVRKLTLPLVVTRPFRGPATLGTLRPVSGDVLRAKSKCYCYAYYLCFSF